jgi:hypothetical protein
LIRGFAWAEAPGPRVRAGPAGSTTNAQLPRQLMERT